MERVFRRCRVIKDTFLLMPAVLRAFARLHGSSAAKIEWTGRAWAAVLFVIRTKDICSDHPAVYCCAHNAWTLSPAVVAAVVAAAAPHAAEPGHPQRYVTAFHSPPSQVLVSDALPRVCACGA